MCEAKFSIEIGNGNPKLLIRVPSENKDMKAVEATSEESGNARQ